MQGQSLFLYLEVRLLFLVLNEQKWQKTLFWEKGVDELFTIWWWAGSWLQYGYHLTTSIVAPVFFVFFFWKVKEELYITLTVVWSTSSATKRNNYVRSSCPVTDTNKLSTLCTCTISSEVPTTHNMITK